MVLAGVLGGCIDYLEPDVGPPTAPRCVNDDSDTSKTVSFSVDIQPIFFNKCRFCHYPSTTGVPIGIATSHLDLSSYQALRAGGNAGAEIVAGMPCASILFQKVGPGPPFGSRMPLSGPPFLDDASIQLIHDWIAEGTLAN